MLLLAALAVVPTALAYTCYFRGLRATSAGTGSVLALLEPLTGTVLAALLLGERLGPAGLAAGRGARAGHAAHRPVRRPRIRPERVRTS